MSFNKAMIIGYLGQDPEIRYTPTGMPVVNLSVATDETYVDKDGQRQEPPNGIGSWSEEN